MKKPFSHNEVASMCIQLKQRILDKATKSGVLKDSAVIKLFGIPRGGVPVCYALQMISALGGKQLVLVDSPEHADIFIDDVIDTGRTKHEWGKRFDTPFLALVDKTDLTSPYRDKWVMFPWEDQAKVNDDSIVGTLTNRIREANGQFFANDNIASFFASGELSKLEDELTTRAKHFLRGLVIDIDNDHNTKDSARRLAKMYLHEVFRGRYTEAPSIADFPNAKKLDEMYATGPITIRSGCSHHFVPIMGQCWVGVIPGERVIGLSKFNRIVQWIAARPQIQEELAVQIADYLENQIKPKGIAIIIEATHMCMTWRGVKEPMEAKMVNSVMRGIFRENPAAKAEFMNLIKR